MEFKIDTGCICKRRNRSNINIGTTGYIATVVQRKDILVCVRIDKNDAIQIRVTDLNGRIVYTNRGAQRTYSFGQNFVSGMYIAEIKQGDRKQIVKLIKK